MQYQQPVNGLSAENNDILTNRLDDVKNQAINFILYLYSVISLIAVLIRIYFRVFYYKIGWDVHMNFYVAAYLVILGATVFQNRLSYQLKVYVILSVFLIFGIHSLVAWKLVGGGRIWLIMFCLYVAVFFNTRKGIYSVILVCMLISTTGGLVCFDVIEFNPEKILFASKSINNWLTSTIIIILNIVCLLYSQGKFNQLLNESIVVLTDQAKTLEKEIAIRRKTETALRESELRYRVLFESAGDSILLLKNETIIDCNRKTCELLEKEREEIVMHTPYEFSPGVQPDGSRSKEKVTEILKSLSRHDSKVVEWTHTKSDGQEVYVEICLTQMELHDTVYILAILRNVTDRKHAEVKLFQEKQFTETVINSLPGVFFMFDEGKHHVRWNKNLELITGYSSADLRKMSAEDWVAEDGKAYISHKFQEAIVEGKIDTELDIVTKSGKVLPYYIVCIGMNVDNRSYMIGTGFDLTDRKEAEQALAVSERRFRELVETISVGICIIKDGVLVYLNPKQLEIFGKYPTSFKVNDLPLNPDDLFTVMKSYETVVAGVERTFEHEVRVSQFRRQTGRKSTRIVFCNGSRITYMGEAAVLMTMADITKTRELEDLVHLREKMASLGHVAAGIAHEIRNPLSGINILIDGILEDFEDPENAEGVKKDIHEIQKASNKISGVIKRVLDFSRPGKPSLTSSNINSSVMEAVELSRVTLRKEGVKIDTKLAVNLPQLQIDNQAIEQVFLNLINNAAIAMKSVAGDKKIEIATWYEDESVFISIADSGNGISDELKEKVFDPFFTTRSDGSGIGLSLSQRIITDHGGTIQVVDSDLGGAEFKIKLPS